MSNSIERLLGFDCDQRAAEQFVAAATQAFKGAGHLAVVMTPTSARCAFRRDLLRELRAAGFDEVATEIARVQARKSDLLVVGRNGKSTPRFFVSNVKNFLTAAAMRAGEGGAKNGGTSG